MRRRGFTPLERWQGFSLIELIAIVVILSVLAAVGLPTYSRTMERSYWQEAQDVLYTIYHGQRSYYLTTNTYYGPLDQTSAMAAWRTIYMDNPNLGAIPVTFTVTAAGSGSTSTFAATATRVGGSCDGKDLQIDQTRVVTGTWPSSGDC